MLEGFLGSNVFQAGINSFLQEYAYDNAVTAQLWEKLTEAWNNAGVQVSNDGQVFNVSNRSGRGPCLITMQLVESVITIEKFEDLFFSAFVIVLLWFPQFVNIAISYVTHLKHMILSLYSSIYNSS